MGEGIEDILKRIKPSDVTLKPIYYSVSDLDAGIGEWRAIVWFGFAASLRSYTGTGSDPLTALQNALNKKERHELRQ